MTHFLFLIFSVFFLHTIVTNGTAKNSTAFLAFASTEKLRSEIQFIAPNEYNFTDLNPLLKGSKGVLITVGTFRALHAASLANYDEVYLIDSNKVAIDFNLNHLEAISSSQNREEYLNKLFQSDKASILIQEAYANKISLKKLSKLLQSLSISSEDPRGLSAQFPFSDFYQHRLIDFITNPVLFENSFLGSDNLFNRLHRLIINGKLRVLPGSIAGSKSMKWLAKNLTERQLVVSVLDISNTEEYINGNKEHINFLLNLESLPTSNNTQLIKTRSQQSLGSNYSWWKWSYVSVDLGEYLRHKRLNLEFWHKVPKRIYPEKILSKKTRCEIAYH